MTKQYNPHWPFPQYDENGKRMMPPGWNKTQPKPVPYPADLGDALL